MPLGKASRKNLDALRRIVFVRDRERCLAQGVFGFCGGPLTLQHRAARGMGGSASMDTFHNLVTMCATHNELDTASADFHRLCIRLGWSMPRWVHDQGFADIVPVWYAGLGWFLLEDDGRVSILGESEAKRIMVSIYGVGFEATGPGF
jgi:hypothetical protein